MAPAEEFDQRELYNSALLFAYVLGNVFRNGEGMVIELTGDLRHQFGDGIDKVLVFLKEDQIQVIPCINENLEDGDWVNVFDGFSDN